MSQKKETCQDREQKHYPGSSKERPPKNESGGF